MDTDANDQAKEKAIAIINRLQTIQRRLRYIHVPVAITTENLRLAQKYTHRLQTLSKRGLTNPTEVGEITRETEEIMQRVFRELDISNPNYAPAQVMAEQAAQARTALLKHLKMLLTKSTGTLKGRKTLFTELKDAIDGNDIEHLSAVERIFVEGLLTGMSCRQILAQCHTPDSVSNTIRLMRMYPFNELQQLFDPRVALGEISWPQSLGNNGYGESITEPLRSYTSECEEDEAELDFDTVLQKYESDAYPQETEDNQCVQQPDKDKSKGFLGLLNWRLKSANVQDEQRIRILNGVKAILEGERWRSTEKAECVFIEGLMSGQDAESMLYRCLAMEDTFQLAGLLSRVDLRGLQIGKDWVFTRSGRLTVAPGFSVDNILDALIALGGNFPSASALSVRTDRLVLELLDENKQDVFYDCVE